MQSFSEPGVHLKSSLELEVSRAGKASEGSWVVLCRAQPELDESCPQVEKAKTLYGKLAGSQIYVLDPQARQALALLDRSSISSLDNTKPGKRHISFALGAALADLIKSRSELWGAKPIHLELESLLAKHVSYPDEALAAMRLRFVKNRLGNEAKPNKVEPTRIVLSVSDDKKIALSRALTDSERLAGAMICTRSLVNAPANLLRPDSYERIVSALAKELASEADGEGAEVSFEALKGADLIERRCHLVAAVGRGSTSEPRLLKLQYRPPAAKDASLDLPHVALVGKGITFDSGGYDLKPSAAMRNMKKDMGGSAAALGVFVAAVRMGLPGAVDCYLALAENMVSGNALRPGDVLTARDGSLVEIDNTDAEGRLVLSDALHLAAETKPDWILDFATLTGAARIALGGDVDALFSNEAEKALLVTSSGVETGDWVWHLPRVSSYGKLLESGVADTTNSATTGLGGAITAAAFLERFVGGVPWTHIDTYMWSDRANSLTSAEPGATAKCVRLAIESLRRFLAK